MLMKGARPVPVPRRHFFFLLHRDKYKSAGIKAWLALCRGAGAKG
jgi:hypothetical protein